MGNTYATPHLFDDEERMSLLLGTASFHLGIAEEMLRTAASHDHALLSPKVNSNRVLTHLNDCSIRSPAIAHSLRRVSQDLRTVHQRHKE